MTFEITTRNHFKSVAFHLIGTSMMIIALFFLRFEPQMTKIFAIFWAVYTIPALYLHLEYYLINRGQKLIILEDEFITQYRTGNEKRYKFDEVQNVMLYKSASLDKGGLQLSAIESYHYAKFILKQGDEIIVTCLMAPKVEDVIKQMKVVRYERKKRLFSSPYLS